MGGGAPYIFMLSRGEWFPTGVNNMEGTSKFGRVGSLSQYIREAWGLPRGDLIQGSQ